MNRSIRMAASNQEMYALLSRLQSLGAVILNSEAEPLTVDPLAFHHLPRIMYASFPQSGPLVPQEMPLENDVPAEPDAMAAQVMVLRTTRFGVGKDGKPVCYPGCVSVAEDVYHPAPRWLTEAFDALHASMKELIAFRLDTAEYGRYVYVFPDASSFVREGSVDFDH